MLAYGLDRKEKNFIPNVMFSPFSDDVYRLFFLSCLPVAIYGQVLPS